MGKLVDLGYNLGLLLLIGHQPIIGFYTGWLIGNLIKGNRDYELYPYELAIAKNKADIATLKSMIDEELKQLYGGESPGQDFALGR